MSNEGHIITELDTETKNWICYKPVFFYTEQNLAVLPNRRLLFLSNQDTPRVRTWIEKFSSSRKMHLSPHTQHYMMLPRNLFYTGLTRAKKLAIVVGAEKAINLAINSNRQMERHTKLKHRALCYWYFY
ncbi:RecD/TraA family helicase [Calothrix sp. NIES-4071]|nr:RecD/TraA family helicase [Calothrix sp. NIES-4071]BAZ60894.1 RecD/TraA family helicase [Calothrix sp. NIES-4105]